MCSRFKRSVVVGLVGSLAALASPRIASGGVICTTCVVETGWDLFETTAATFAEVGFEGVPLGTFDFGGGAQNTGNTDTIVERLGVASVPSAPGTAPPIAIELVALQLVSLAPVDLGAGFGDNFITLQSNRGVGEPVGLDSTGEMVIAFLDVVGGTFSSFIDVAFDLRFGSLDGPIFMSAVLQLSADGVPWDRISPPDAIQINGVNHFLNGVDTSTDFWPDDFTEEHLPSGATHSVTPGTPEPASLLLLAIGSLVLARYRRRADLTRRPLEPRGRCR